MNYRSLFLISAIILGCAIPTLKAAIIIEIINNTDRDLIVQSLQSNTANIIASISLETGLRIQPKQIHPSFPKFARRTRNIVNGIAIPIEQVEREHRPMCFGKTQQLSHSSLRISIGSYKNPFLGLYQKGAFLGIDGYNGVARVEVSGQTIMENSYSDWWECITGENIDSHAYSIEVKQLTPGIGYRTLPGQSPLIRRNTLEVSIKKINRKDLVIPQNTERPKAYIVNFRPGTITCGYTIACVGFDQVITDNSTEEFCEFIKNCDIMRNLSKVRIGDSDGKRHIVFHIYTSITQQDFQRLLDQANRMAFLS